MADVINTTPITLTHLHVHWRGHVLEEINELLEDGVGRLEHARGRTRWGGHLLYSRFAKEDGDIWRDLSCQI